MSAAILNFPHIPNEQEIFALARSIIESDPVIETFASCEWDELHEDGRVWLCAIVRETWARAIKSSAAASADYETVRAEIINSPETADFMAGVAIEAAHQRDRWGSDHDAGKSPFDWFWLIGYLAQKAADAATQGDFDKARHHTISTAAALNNWHRALSGIDLRMRPGIEPPEGGHG